MNLNLSLSSLKSVSVWPGLALGLFFGLVYGWCAAPGVTWGDSGEFASVAVTLGIPHPTGYPLYSLLSKLWTSLPFWSPARGLNLFSAFAAAGAVWGLFAFSREWLEECFPKFERTQVILTAAVTAALFGASPTLFSQAVITEVYTLSAFLQVMSWLALIRWWRGRSPLAGYFFWVGLGLAHHLSLLLLVPFQLLILLAGFRKPDKDEKEILSAAAWALPGLCLYLYIPLRAQMDPVINWGDPAGLSGLLWMVRGGDFRAMLQFDPLFQGGPAVLYLVFRDHAVRLLREFSGISVLLLIPLFLLIYQGTLKLFDRLLEHFELTPGKKSPENGEEPQKFWPGVMLAAVMFSAFLLSFYMTGDREVFFILTYPLTAVLIGWAIGLLLGVIKQRLTGNPGLLWVVAGVGLVLAASQLVYSVNNHSAREDTAAEDFGREVVAAVPEGSLLLVGLNKIDTDNSLYPLWYQKWALGKAEDKVIIGANFFTSSWIKSQFQDEPLWLPDKFELLARGLVQEVPGMGTPFISRGAWVQGVHLFLRNNQDKYTLYTLSQIPELAPYYRMELVAEVEVKPGSVSEEYQRFLPDGRIYRLTPRE
jgi:hypothetical protein